VEPGKHFRREWIAGALVVNAIVVSAPLMFVDVPTVFLLPVLLLLAGSTLMCATEIRDTSGSAEMLSEFGSYQYAALAGSLLLLFTKWSSLLECMHFCHATGRFNMFAGCVLVVTGCVLRSLSIRILANGFRSESSGILLRTDGVYSVLRHPSELGLLLASLGFTTILGSWRTALILLPVTLLLSLVRTRLEERSLRSCFGVEYAGYCNRTGGLLPRLKIGLGGLGKKFRSLKKGEEYLNVAD